MQECNDETSPVTGATLVEQAHKNFETMQRKYSSEQPMWFRQRVAQTPLLLPTTTHQHVFLHQSYLHSFDSDSGLLGKMSVICKYAAKGVACCALIKIKISKVKSLDSRT